MKKILCSLVAVLLCASLFAGCGGQQKLNGSDTAAPSAPQESPDNNAAYESESGGAYGDAFFEEDGGALLDAPEGLKIIYSASLELETLDFDESRAAIRAAVAQAGGYISYENNYGGYRYDSDRYRVRSANYTIRIPVDNYEAFLGGAASFGNVTEQSTSSQDITTVYIDTEARLAALRAQETRLLELLGQSGSLEDLLAIEEKLSDVRYQIESYTSTMKTYDNQLAYCTVELYLHEVATITVQNTSFGDRILSAVQDSLRSIWAFLQDFAIGVIYVAPYLIIALLLFLLIRAVVRKRRAKHPPKPSAPVSYAGAGVISPASDATRKEQEKENGSAL